MKKREKTDEKSALKIPKIDLSMKLNVAILIFFSLLIIWGIVLVRNKLLYNANEMGTYLAQSYASEEENRMTMYKLFLNLASINVNEILADEEATDEEELQQWFVSYSSHLSQILQYNIIDPYAVIDGKIIAAAPWEGDEEYEYQDTEWYQKAMEADGEIIFTNAYKDIITGENIVTLARKIDGNGNVLAFDILMKNFHAHKNKATIPEDSSYFLFDGTGELIYAASDLDLNQKDAQDYIANLLEEIESGSLADHSATISDLDGRNRGVYYYAMDNGWLSVITIPIYNILHDELDRTIVILSIICGALVVIVAVTMVRSYLGSRKMKYTADTLSILGDTYYAIYRVNYETGTYESIKSSEDVRQALGKTGDYQHLIDEVKQLVNEKTYQEFEQSFSLENIRRLIQDHVEEFGGDYQRRFGDEYKWVSIKIIYNKHLALNEVIMCFREIDMEKRKQLQQHALLENALNSAKQTVAKKNLFFSNVSHDMRTPLNAITGLSELANKNLDDPEKVRDYMEKIENAGKQLLTLVNDILDMSRLEHGEGSSLDYAVMNLKTCVEESASLFLQQARREDKVLNITAELENPLVYCDHFRLNQILNNLISNAFKYSTKGSVIQVELRQIDTQSNHGKYQIQVKDTGIGMSQEFLEKIFEPFARETTFAPTKVSGTGLGMPIVKSLVQQMSGEITVQSTLGKGTCITIILPLQIAEAESNETQESQASGPQAKTSDLTGLRVLIAEDNDINMEIATEFLTMLGAEVIQAWNGKEAVDIFRTLDPGSVDVILMDMQMPEMDGCTASRTIRSLNRKDAARIPIIAVTANAFAEDIARTKEAGMNAHIAKPMDFNLLVQILNQVREQA